MENYIRTTVDDIFRGLKRPFIAKVSLSGNSIIIEIPFSSRRSSQEVMRRIRREMKKKYSKIELENKKRR